MVTFNPDLSAQMEQLKTNLRPLDKGLRSKAKYVLKDLHLNEVLEETNFITLKICNSLNSIKQIGSDKSQTGGEIILTTV